MYKNKPLLWFQMPQSQLVYRQSSRTLLPRPLMKLKFASANIVSWGTDRRNYIMQQLYRDQNELEICQVDIRVEKNSLLPVNCARDFGALLYMLEGNADIGVKGYTPLALHAGTYSLQLLPAGNHQLLAGPGSHALLYISVKQILQQLNEEVPAYHFLMQLAASKKPKRHWPLTRNIYALLQQFVHLPRCATHLSVQGLVALLLQQLKHQTETAYLPGQYPSELLPGFIQSFVATNIGLPVQEQMKRIEIHFGISQKELDYYFKKMNL